MTSPTVILGSGPRRVAYSLKPPIGTRPRTVSPIGHEFRPTEWRKVSRAAAWRTERVKRERVVVDAAMRIAGAGRV